MFEVKTEIEERPIDSIQARTFTEALGESRRLLRQMNCVGAQCTIYEQDIPVVLVTYLERGKCRGYVLGMVAGVS